MGRPSSRFEIETFRFSNGWLTTDFPGEPKEGASYWKAVADSLRIRLDKTVEANRANRQGKIKAERRLAALKAQEPTESQQE